MINLNVVKTIVTTAVKDPKVLVGAGFVGGVGTSVAVYKVVNKVKRSLREAADEILYDMAKKQRGNRKENYLDYNSYFKRCSEYDNLVFDTKKEAEETLNMLYNSISEYDFVSVSDLYDFIGISSKFIDNSFGWSDLSGSRVIRVRDGYKLHLPNAILCAEAKINENGGNKNE